MHLPASWITSHTTQHSYNVVMSTTITWLIIKILHHNSAASVALEELADVIYA